MPESEYDSDEIERMSLTQFSNNDLRGKKCYTIASSDSESKLSQELNQLTKNNSEERLRTLRSGIRKNRPSESPELDEAYCRGSKKKIDEKKQKVPKQVRNEIKILMIRAYL